MGDRDQIASFYNSHQTLSREDRHASRILHLRNFNNWVKSVIIQKYVMEGFCVLDFCGGKGGDMLKWGKARVGHLVLADVALESVGEAKSRYEALRDRTFSATFMATDCFHTRLAEHIPNTVPQFDFVSCQFAFHYSFETEARARMALQNCSDRLRPGAFVACTIPNAEFLLSQRKKSKDARSFGNSVYRITFDTADEVQDFGTRYIFHLEEAVDAPEYVVQLPVLKRIAAEAGLQLEWSITFPDFYQRYAAQFSELVKRMNVRTVATGVDEEQWEAISVYMVVVLKKTGGMFKPQKQKVTRKDSPVCIPAKIIEV